VAGKAKQRRIQLSELQLAVMRELWRRGEAPTAEVAAVFQAERGLAHTTVATLLTRLEKRGVVAQRRDGRTLLYRPRVSEDEVRRSMVSELVANLFRGDSAALLAHLVGEDEVTPKEVAAARSRLGVAQRKDAKGESDV